MNEITEREFYDMRDQRDTERTKNIENRTRIAELEAQNAELRNIFNFVTLVPDGHVLARAYLEGRPYTFERLGRMTVDHLEQRHSTELLAHIAGIREKLPEALRDLAPFFGCLPKGDAAMRRFIGYAQRDGYTPRTLSTATRHHLYDEVLYHSAAER